MHVVSYVKKIYVRIEMGVYCLTVHLLWCHSIMQNLNAGLHDCASVDVFSLFFHSIFIFLTCFIKKIIMFWTWSLAWLCDQMSFIFLHIGVSPKSYIWHQLCEAFQGTPDYKVSTCIWICDVLLFVYFVVCDPADPLVSIAGDWRTTWLTFPF